MKEHELFSPPGSRRGPKRIGRGVGSGHGKTSGRGTKGQKARAGGSIARYFQGGQNPVHKKLPYKRGFTNNFRVEYNVVNVGDLERFEAGSTVTIDQFFASRLARRKRLGVKLLGEGSVAKGLTVQVHRISAVARAKIEAAGGQVELLESAAEDETSTSG